jgi:2-polyprenyl-3-methyl-5-hydroxy-6-metoxy-1,4-benzoquinol methylase
MNDADLRHPSAIPPEDVQAAEAGPRCLVCGAGAAQDESYRPLELYRCTSCGFVFPRPRDSAELQELYGDVYFDEYPGGEAYEEDERQRRYEARLRVALVRRYLTSGRLLEVGAAGGHFLDEARDAGFECVGLEPAPGYAESARERFGLDVRAGFVEDADLPAASFDVVCAWHVVEHLADPRAALERVRTLLHEGGHLLVEVPNIDSVYAKRRRARWFNLDPEHHVGHYSRASLQALLLATGFELLAMETFPMLGYVRPARALRPGNVAVQAKELLDVRTRPRSPHPSKHELLRAFARRPS